MSYKIKTIPPFDKDFKRLFKRYRSLIDDVRQLMNDFKIRFLTERLRTCCKRLAWNKTSSVTYSKNKRILQNKDIVEAQGGRLVFVDPIYRLWFSKEYE